LAEKNYGRAGIFSEKTGTGPVFDKFTFGSVTLIAQTTIIHVTISALFGEFPSETAFLSELCAIIM
jgi:hypothetical protein